MKFSCSVEISTSSKTRCHACMRAVSKKATGTLALCQKRRTRQQIKNKDIVLFIKTHLRPKGVQYRIYNNAELSVDHAEQGKAVIRFKDPANDVIITEANPFELKVFLHAVGLTLVGQGAGKVPLSPIPRKVERPKIKLAISGKKDYSRNKSRFPSSLSWLQVSNSQLVQIDRQVLQLDHLQVLDLSNNSIRSLPPELGNLSLRELILNHNKIQDFPVELSVGKLGKTLHILDLSFNLIPEISPYFCMMRNVTVVSLKCNKLAALPRNLYCMTSLKMFNASHNRLRVLPFAITELHLDYLDVAHNDFETDVCLRPQVPWKLRSLREWAATSVIENNVKCAVGDLPPNLNDYLTERCHCPCGRLVFQQESSCTLVLDISGIAAHVTYVKNISHFKVAVEIFFCSTRCWEKATNQCTYHRIGK